MDWLSWNNSARELVMWMADASLRAVLLATLALLVVPLLRRSASAEHMTWTLILAGMLGVPFLRPVVPAAYVHLPRVLSPHPTKIAPHVRLSASPSGVSATMSLSPAKTSLPAPPLWPLYVLAAYLAGLMLCGSRLLGGVLLTRRTLRDARTIHSELWQYYELIAAANVDLNLEESESVRVPLTTGSKLMRVILPADWRGWPQEKLTAILAHELAHARRRDPLVALVVAINKCLFWFHPLAWWLERRLPVLAEHVADDAALSISSDAGTYARLLLESAAALEARGNRLIWHSAAIGGPVVARRIRRVLSERTAERLKPLGKIGRAMLLLAGALLIWISTAVNVPGLAAGQANRADNVHWPGQMTAAQAAALEQDLAANPEDEATRGKLLRYYMFDQMCDAAVRLGLQGPPSCSDRGGQKTYDRIPLILWLIDHHPESKLFGEPGTFISPQVDGPNVYEEARDHWLTQINLHPNDARVLGNAAGSLSFDGMQEQMDLLKRAQKLDPARWTEPLARVYSAVLVSDTSYADNRQPGLAAQIKNEMQASSDIAMVGSVARFVVERAARAAIDHRSGWDFNAMRILASELVAHAQTLDPQNREWSDLMEGVKALPTSSPAAQATPSGVQAIRVGGMVQAQNLLESPAPIYPPEAKSASVQGTVKVQIRIGADGHVTEATAISGNPMLINAALDAAKSYLYKPTLLNNRPVEVLTDVDIVFQLPKP